MSAPGFLLAGLSAVFNGSFVAFAKIKSVAQCDLHPFLFNFYVALGVFLSCWLAAPFLPLVGVPLGISPFGVAAGALFVGASGFSFVAASKLGLSTGQGVWSGMAIVVSFLWGVIGPAPISHAPRSPTLSGVAVALLLAGVVGIVKCEPIGAFVGSACCVARHNQPMSSEAAHTDTLLVNRADCDGGAAGGARAGAAERMHGLLAALAVGVFGGSILAPAAFAGPDFSGAHAINFLPSFGIGVMAAATLFSGGWYLVQATSGAGAPPLHLRSTLWAGICSGVVWNAGNVCSLLAINTYGTPFGVAYPILQTSLVVGAPGARGGWTEWLTVAKRARTVFVPVGNSPKYKSLISSNLGYEATIRIA